MRIDCRHGYFMFHEEQAGEVARFSSLYNFKLSRIGSFFTFDSIKDAPNYSLKSHAYMGNVATANFCGDQWEVFEQNNLVYDFARDAVVNINSIVTQANLYKSSYYLLADGFLLPGSLVKTSRVKSYSAFFLWDTLRFRYSEVQLG